jgi:immune inhibitor A
VTGDVVVDFEGESGTRLADLDAHSGDFIWWSNRGDDFDTRLTRSFDFTEIAAGDPLTMTAAMWWDIEEDYDYGYVLASRDGRKWTPLAGEYARTADPGGNAFGPGYTAMSNDAHRPVPDEMLAPRWVTDVFDLSDFAGDRVQIRFEYVTDDAVNNSGWFVDDVAIPAVDYFSDFEDGADGWASEGWLLTDNHLQQRWLVQALTLDENRLASVERPEVDPATGSVSFEIDDLGDNRTAVLAISALAPVTTERAEYAITVRQRE